MHDSGPIFDEVVRRFCDLAEDPSRGVAVDGITLARKVGGSPRTSLDSAAPIQALAAVGQRASAFFVIDAGGRALIFAAWPCGAVKVYDAGPIALAA